MKQHFEQPDPTYARLVEQYSALIPSSPEKLKFLRTALEKYHISPLAERVGWLKQLTFRKVIIEELLPYLPDGVPKPRELSLIYWLYRVRYPIYFSSILATVLMTIMAGQWVYGHAQQAGLLDLKLMSEKDRQVVVVNQPAPAPPVKDQPAAVKGTEGSKESVEDYAPEQIWLVEKGADYELYSNGARILTKDEVETDPRSYYAFYRKPNKEAVRLPFETHLAAYYPVLKEKPIGILYHATQSDLLPFASSYNRKLNGNMEHLVDYVRQEKLYNYVIDRFGRIHRVVKDEDFANHSGNSIWGDKEAVYINLNNSFIGVAFEGKWSADVKLSADDVNEAQIYAGKMLTQILRSKYKISDTNCVTHGMVSINPSTYLIGYHMDWAIGFPFNMVGLTDKYQQPPTCIAEFGFKYDRSFQAAIGGKLWPGIDLAEAQLRARAADVGITTDALKHQLQNDFTLYHKWVKEMREQAKAAGKVHSSEPEDEGPAKGLFSQ